MGLSPALAAQISRHRHGRVPRTLREQQLLALAGDLFAQNGFAGTSMDELARRAGISKPVVYELLGSKEQVYRRCVLQQSEELAAAIAAATAPETDPGHRLEAGVLAFFRFVQAHRRVWEALAGEVSPFAEQAAQVRRRQTELATALIADGARALGLELDTTRIEATAHLVNGAVEGLARWWGEHPELSPEQCAGWVVDLVLPGLESMTISRSGTGPSA
ncbi:MAG: TetR/AcrR family transcriptional regulator [Candidatus Dormibacteraeota bacterium]|nr:TetR/AcrR family transcriptional regulator [Candidatus Dormibacteraeota bacterium]